MFASFDNSAGATARWLMLPAALDGWRIDVANMTGRHGTVDLNHQVATGVRVPGPISLPRADFRKVRRPPVDRSGIEKRWSRSRN